MPKFFMVGIVLFLLLGAGYGLAQAARTIHWDCSDWQAFAHEDRTIAILESLAENRGKTLYCGIDQSDTFAKAETWEAGKDRNERDDTIYSGESGIFRGFIAAQEGWLTDGESGITGISRDRIFEFPKKERRRKKRWVTQRRSVPADAARLLRSEPGSLPAAASTSAAEAQTNAENAFSVTTNWQTLAETTALAYCQSRNYDRLAAPVSLNPTFWEYGSLSGTVWVLGRDADSRTFWFRYSARQARTWSAVCERRVRRRR